MRYKLTLAKQKLDALRVSHRLPAAHRLRHRLG
jgi:hypothetical protein